MFDAFIAFCKQKKEKGRKSSMKFNENRNCICCPQMPGKTVCIIITVFAIGLLLPTIGSIIISISGNAGKMIKNYYIKVATRIIHWRTVNFARKYQRSGFFPSERSSFFPQCYAGGQFWGLFLCFTQNVLLFRVW